jgi:hypothetical protein
MVDLSSSLCKRLPEAKSTGFSRHIATAISEVPLEEAKKGYSRLYGSTGFPEFPAKKISLSIGHVQNGLVQGKIYKKFCGFYMFLPFSIDNMGVSCTCSLKNQSNEYGHAILPCYHYKEQP